MTVGPLATSADLAARLGTTLNESQAARATALLADASALIRDYIGQVISLVEDDEEVLKTQGSTIVLPERPVSAVTSVTAPDGTVLVEDADWTWDEIDRITVHTQFPARTYAVVYTHGLAEIPDGIVARCCAMVLRVLTAPTATEGLGGETIGQYSYQAPGGSAGVSVWLSKADEQALRRYRRGAGTIMVRGW